MISHRAEASDIEIRQNAPGTGLKVPLNQKPQGRVGREAPKSLLRLPQDLRDYLSKEANLNGRSVNSEIINRLELSRQRQNGARQRGDTA